MLKYGIGASNLEKVQQYIEQMYTCGMFTESEMINLENKNETDKTWANAKSYFEALYNSQRLVNRNNTNNDLN